MMSGNRQRITGSAIKKFLILSVGMAALWWLPSLVVHYWPGLMVEYKESWLLEISDLTWKRVVINAVTKPGFRVMWVVLWSGGWIIKWLFPVSTKKQPHFRTWRQRLTRASFRSSMEWVMDGKRASAIKEYARLVGVI